MPVTVQMPDGSTAQFPDGMKPEEIQSAIEGHMASGTTPAARERKPAGDDEGFFDSALDSSGLSTLGHAVMHPLETGKSVVGFLNDLGGAESDSGKESTNPITQGLRNIGRSSLSDLKQGIADYRDSGLSLKTRRDFGRAVPIVGPLLAHAQEQYDAGNGAGAAGTLTGFVGGIAGPEAVAKVPGALRDFVRGPIHEPIPGTRTTPLQRYNSARNVGAQLDAADATNSPILNGVKRLGENSLAGGHVYDRLKASNTAAVSDAMDDFLNSMHKGDRENLGSTIQSGLRTDQGRLRTGAEQGFDQLSEETKGRPVKGAKQVGKTASELLKPIEDLGSRYPSLAPTKTMSVLSDLKKIGQQPKPPARTFLDRETNYFPPAPKSIPITWSDLQRLRSGTHDLTSTNPDLVKSQALAPLQQMTSALDDAMTNSTSGLTPRQIALFRRSNNAWKEMKETYDDPSSPYFHAIRTDNPSSLSAGVGPKTAENARGLMRRLSPIEEFPEGVSPALGALRRGTVESALKPNNEGAPNFARFGTELNRIPEDYRAELFSPAQNDTLRDFNRTTNALSKDFNPSGSAKMGQKIAEGAAMFPMKGLPLLQYPVAKLMTNPAVVDWLMKESAKHTALPPVGATAIVAAAGRRPKND